MNDPQTKTTNAMSRVYTRAKTFGSILSLDNSMKKEAMMTLVPLRKISPV